MIEVGVAGLGVVKGAHIHPDYPCALCSVWNKHWCEVGVAGFGGGRKRGCKGAHKHPDYPCTLCSVCKNTRHQIVLLIYQHMKLGKIYFVEHVRSVFPSICDSDCICETCRQNLTRNLLKDDLPCLMFLIVTQLMTRMLLYLTFSSVYHIIIMFGNI